MLTTLVATMCSLAVLGACVDEKVESSKTDRFLNWQTCQFAGQQIVAHWMREHPIYHDGYKSTRYKCVPGEWNPPGVT